jgi:chromosome segregation ATPase
LTDKTEEIQAPSKPCTKSSAKRFPMHIVQLELVEGANKGIDERQVELGEENANVQEMKQQLKQAQHVIAQFYQENRELRRQLAERIIETPASQSRAGQLPPTSPTMREGNVNWLKKQLREAQDVIIELREEQRMSEEKITEHFKECRPTIDNACATLSSAQSKLKRNVVLLRQVKSLNKWNWSLRKTVRDLRFRRSWRQKIR